jgi:hypothetical protein
VIEVLSKILSGGTRHCPGEGLNDKDGEPTSTKLNQVLHIGSRT